jgi:hypothetical protein
MYPKSFRMQEDRLLCFLGYRLAAGLPRHRDVEFYRTLSFPFLWWALPKTLKIWSQRSTHRHWTNHSRNRNTLAPVASPHGPRDKRICIRMFEPTQKTGAYPKVPDSKTQLHDIY